MPTDEEILRTRTEEARKLIEDLGGRYLGGEEFSGYILVPVKGNRFEVYEPLPTGHYNLRSTIPRQDSLDDDLESLI